MLKKHKELIVGVILGALLFNGLSVIATNGLKTIEVFYDNIKIYLNGKEIKTDAEPFIYEGRTYVPVRFVSEAFGANVKWNESTKTIEITNNSTSTSTKNTDIPTILKAEFINNGTNTAYAVAFSDGFAIALGKSVVDLAFPNYNTVSLIVNTKNMIVEKNIAIPNIIAYDYLGNKYYPVEFDTYKYDLPEEVWEDYRTLDFYENFTLNSTNDSITGILAYKKFSLIDRIYYDDGVHKCILYLYD